jgi:hypothetical protein
MKRVILICILTVFALNANSQVVVRKSTVKDSLVWIPLLSGTPELRNYYTETTNDYTLFFRNEDYKVLVDYQHISLGEKEDALKFFNALQSVFNTGDDMFIEVDKKTWMVSKLVFSIHLRTDGISFLLTPKQVSAIIKKLS